ncbi:hypothetical protein GA0070624_3882 [Micromonospora rhizosphaerae]|uniref:Nuclease n=1 Tax=Micromonospora rhizosphaerae TaxID=568872 RepID=A0A1C6SJ20_9ACTN|nr:nuclease [Micromonospora rhizosphaerae]SCL29433.1 hypothetical protein GA0070624_3882 [Micromonospora rhizosphaerae]
MPMLVITGSFRVVGAAPDGDSVRFHPTDPAHWDRVEGPHRVRRNASGGAQLRLDGIDALETHYTAGRVRTHQPLDLGRASASALLSGLGFRTVRRDERETVTDAWPVEVPGYLFTRGADVYGRCVALAGRGAPPTDKPSGERVHVTVPMLRRTVNYRQLARGQAYPTFYRKLYADLRQAMARAVVTARAAGGPLWRADQTASGAALPAGLADLERDVVLLPKLFRRLAGYFALNDGDPSLAGFADYLDARDDRITLLPTGQWTSLDTIVAVDGNKIRLTHPPEQLFFDER